MVFILFVKYLCVHSKKYIELLKYTTTHMTRGSQLHYSVYFAEVSYVCIKSVIHTITSEGGHAVVSFKI